MLAIDCWTSLAAPLINRELLQIFGKRFGFCICLVTLTALVRFLPRAAKTGDVMLIHILFKRIALVLYVYVYTNAMLLQRKFKASSWPELLFTNVLAD